MDTKIQDFISELKNTYSFSIELWFWEDIQEKILNNADLLDKYYPSFNTSNQSEKISELCLEIEKLREQIFLGSTSKIIEIDVNEIKAHEYLNTALRSLELASKSDVGAHKKTEC